jgi:hypothetical protein
LSQTAVNQFTPSGVTGGGRLPSAALNPQNPSHMFIGCDMGGLYRTENEGLVWQLIPSSIPSENFGNPVPTFGAALRTEIHFRALPETRNVRQTYYYYKVGPKWVRQGDATLTNQNAALLFNIQRACFYNMKAATPNRLISCPWVP